MGQPSFLHFAQPVGGNHFVARLRDGSEIPKFLVVERIGVFASFEEYSGHGGEVVLQTVVDAAEKPRAEGGLEHPAEELDLIASAQSAGALEYLYRGFVAIHLDYLGKKIGAPEFDVAEFILRHGAVHLHGHKVGNYACNLSSCFHIL